MALVGIALGTNLGDKIPSLVAARDALVQLQPEGTILKKQAGIYKTAPVDCPEGSPDFYNTVLEIEFEGTAQQLIELTQSLETKLGRTPKTIHNEARIIDLDILYFDNVILTSDQLEIPHPRMTQRRFVLEPLAEIRPNLILPNQHLSILQLLDYLHSDEPALELVKANW